MQSLGPEDLGIGTTEDVFQSHGTWPVRIERLKSLVKLGAME